MSKSLYGYEKKQLEQRVFGGERDRTFKRYEGVIVEIISSYKQLSELPSPIYESLKSLLNSDFKVVSGLFFVVLTENNDYVLIKSPYEDDELRCIYGSDGNIKGRLIEVEALDSSQYSISNGKNIKITGSYRCSLQDPDENLPNILSGLYGHSMQSTNKMQSFKRNINSGAGIVK